MYFEKTFFELREASRKRGCGVVSTITLYWLSLHIRHACLVYIINNFVID